MRVLILLASAALVFAAAGTPEPMAGRSAAITSAVPSSPATVWLGDASLDGDGTEDDEREDDDDPRDGDPLAEGLPVGADRAAHLTWASGAVPGSSCPSDLSSILRATDLSRPPRA